MPLRLSDASWKVATSQWLIDPRRRPKKIRLCLEVSRYSRL
jgi:hypothetical protein